MTWSLYFKGPKEAVIKAIDAKTDVDEEVKTFAIKLIDNMRANGVSLNASGHTGKLDSFVLEPLWLTL